MVDREVFDRRLAKLEELLRGLRELATVERDTFLQDEMRQAQAERWLHLAAECALDLAHHLIADHGWKTPTTYREAFQILREKEVLDADLASRMERWAGLRNLLVHLYLEIDHARIHDILAGDLDDLEAFAQAMIAAAS